MEFKSLHNQDNPLLICNVWDVASAKTAEALGFRAIGTSSAAVSAMLGYEDGENISFSELCYLVKRIIANTKLPLTVDLESGYSRNPSDIKNHIKALVDLGVVGINIEDSITNPERKLLNAEDFSKTIYKIKSELEKGNLDVFFNVRTDTFLLACANALEETKTRIHFFQEAGADGIFIPCLVNESDIETIVKTTHLPINVMCMPDLPDFDNLKNLGVKRISMGNFLFEKMYNDFENNLNLIIKNQSFKSIFKQC